MEHKYVTNTARIIISVYNIGLFMLVWLSYYNKFAFQKFHVEGAIVSIIIYILIYCALCQLYRGFRIASYSIMETGLSQLISFGIADLLLFVECCLTSNHYINIFPGILIVIAQVSGTFLFVLSFKRYFMNHVPPKCTVLVYGSDISSEEIEDYQNRLMKKYEHLFDIQKVVKESEDICNELGSKEDYYTVMLYEISKVGRGRIMKHCIEQKQTLYFTPSIEDILVSSSESKHLLDTPLLKYSDVKKDALSGVIKRICDVLVSLIILIVTSPIILAAAIAIKLEDHGPVIFKQLRCTYKERKFNIYKFRSMVVDSEKDGFKPCTANDSRITKVGKLIRKLRIDELPQLFNVLKGDMSLVGPRPERIEHVERYDAELPEFRLRSRVKAGLTGYAQIYGKYNTTPYDKLRLDLMYIENQSLILDFKLVLLTIKVVFVPESTEGFTEKNSKAIASERNIATEQTAATLEVTKEGYRNV